MRLKNRGFFYGWVVLGSCVGVGFSYGVFAAFGVFFKYLQNEFGWNRTITSSVQSAHIALLALSTLYIGWLTDRYGPRRALLLGAAFILTGFLLLSQARSLWQVYIFYVLASLGSGVIWALPTATVQRWFLRHRGLTLGITTGGTGLGMFLYPLAAAHLIPALGWRASYAVLGGGTGLLLLLASTFLVASPQEMGLRPYGGAADLAPTAPQAAAGSALPLLRSPAFILISLALILGGLPNMLISTHLVPMATDMGIAETRAAAALGLIGLISVGGRLILGVLGERTGWRAATIISYIGTASAWVWLLFTHNLWMLYTYSIAYGFFHGGRTVTGPGLIGEFFGTRHLAQLIGVAYALNWGFGLLGPLIGGWVFDSAGDYRPAFLGGIASFILGIILLSLLKKP